MLLSKRKPSNNEEEKKSDQNLRINNINSVIGNGLLNQIVEEASESDDPLSSEQILAQEPEPPASLLYSFNKKSLDNNERVSQQRE